MVYPLPLFCHNLSKIRQLPPPNFVTSFMNVPFYKSNQLGVARFLIEWIFSYDCIGSGGNMYRQNLVKNHLVKTLQVIIVVYLEQDGRKKLQKNN